MKEEALPSFKNPPVVETVLGVQFDRLDGFTNGHLGAFWKSLPDGWSHVRNASSLDPTLERFTEGPLRADPGFLLTVTRDPSTRLLIKNHAKDRMIQVQNGRLHYNWLGAAGGEYPRYSKVRSEFDRTFKDFKGFVASEDLGELSPNQWEVTYVNHFPKGTVWNDPGDWVSVFPTLLGPTSKSVKGRFESFEAKWHFEIEPQKGRLHLDIHHGLRSGPEPAEILIMTLTARGPIDPQGMTLDQGLELGRETIVRSFAALTSDEAHEYWGVQG